MQKHHEDLLRARTALRTELSKPLAARDLPQRWWLEDCTIVAESRDASNDEAINEALASQHDVPPGTTWRELADDFRAQILQNAPRFPNAGWTGRS